MFNRLKQKQKSNVFGFWFTAALITQLAIAPNSTVMRIIVQEMDPLMFNSLRSALIVAVTFPFILFALRKFNRFNFMYTVGAGICMAIATLCAVFALQQSQASYVVILSLGSPIVLVFLTHWLLKEKVNLRAAAGVTLAAMGGLVAVTLPLAFHGSASLEFYPLATALIAVNCIFFPLGMIFFRKANEMGLPLPAVQSLASVVILIVSLAGLFAVGTPTALTDISLATWVGIVYSGIGVVFLCRMIIVASYERIGSGPIAALTYLEGLVAVLIPVAVLSERLSLWVVAGGVLILLGLYLTEKHQSRKHYHLLRHH